MVASIESGCQIMNLRVFKLLFVVVLTISAVDFAFAQTPSSNEPFSVVVYRGSDGKLTYDSRKFAKQIISVAKERGYVTLWISANVDFDPRFEELSSEQIEAQADAVRASFDATLAPLIAANEVWHPPSGPQIQGPGCLVRATASGAKKLIRSEEILHILATNIP